MDESQRNNDQRASSSERWDQLTSREGVLSFPQFMTMLTYLSKTYDIPRYGSRERKPRYHYTDAAGLIGIVTSHRLWATDTRFLNDPSEGRFLPERLLALMAAKVGGLSDREKEVIDSIRRNLTSARNAGSTYSVSFCAEGDLLSQWRGYGSFGGGYAIGMELHELHPQLGLFYDVAYGEEEALESVATDLLGIYVRATEKWGASMLDSLCEEAAVLLRNLAHSFKDPTYKEEQESRIVFTHSKNGAFHSDTPLQFRARGGDIVPYMQVALHSRLLRESDPKLPIKQIVSGPGVDYERNYNALKQLLEENGYEGVEIVRSVIPFRS